MLTKQEEFLADFESSVGTKYYAAGKAEGRAEAAAELDAKLLDQGLDPKMVTAITGLTNDGLKAMNAP